MALPLSSTPLVSHMGMDHGLVVVSILGHSGAKGVGRGRGVGMVWSGPLCMCQDMLHTNSNS